MSKNNESDNKNQNFSSGLSVRQNLLKPSIPNEIQSVIEPICTFEVTGKSFIKQKWYECKTCTHYGPNEGMCEVCAKTCHKGHNVVFIKMSNSFFCDCQLKGDCKHHLQTRNLTCTSTLYNGKAINQPMYKCNQCNPKSSKYICQYCAIKFHHGHRLEYLGVVENKVCENNGMNRSPNSIMTLNSSIKPNSE